MADRICHWFGGKRMMITDPVEHTAPRRSGNRIETDLLIVGAGPTGLFAAYYAGFRGLRVCVVESLEQIGGQPMVLYPEKIIRDIAGIPSVSGKDLIERLVQQAAPYSPTYLVGERADSIEHLPSEVVVTTSKRKQIHAKAVLVTAGIGHFSPRILPAAVDFQGEGVRYFVPRLQDLADQDVIVVGGGDSACDWVLALHGIARTVTLVHRRTDFRVHAATLAEIRSLNVDVVTPAEIARIHGDSHVEQVVLRQVDTGQLTPLKAQAVVAALGFRASPGPLAQWGFELSGRNVVVDGRMRTSLDRVFAAGDVATYEGRIPLIAVGFGEAATAVNNLAPIIDPQMAFAPGHSTDVGLAVGPKS